MQVQKWLGMYIIMIIKSSNDLGDLLSFPWLSSGQDISGNTPKGTVGELAQFLMLSIKTCQYTRCRVPA